MTIEQKERIRYSCSQCGSIKLVECSAFEAAFDAEIRAALASAPTGLVAVEKERLEALKEGR